MKVLSAIYGVLLILAGILVIFHPFASMFAIGVVIGIFLLVGGINTIIAAIKFKKSAWNIVMGILTTLAALAILFSYSGGLIALNVLVVIMAIIFMLQGICEIMAGVTINKMKSSAITPDASNAVEAAATQETSVGLFIFSGILYILLSIMLFVNPISGMFLIEGVVAATLMMEGIDHLMHLS